VPRHGENTESPRGRRTRELASDLAPRVQAGIRIEPISLYRVGVRSTRPSFAFSSAKFSLKIFLELDAIVAIAPVDSTERILSRLNFLAVIVEYSAQRSAGNIAKQLGIKPPRLASSFRSRSLIFAIVLFYGESTFREMIHSPLTCSLNRYAFPDLCAAA